MAQRPDITLEHHGTKFGLFLVGGVKGIQETSAEESTFNARFGRGKKRYGADPFLCLAEFRDWTGGRGAKNFEDDPDSYSDGVAWTLTPGTALPPPQWKIATGLRSENRYMPGNMSWRRLLTVERYISVPFSASSGYTAAHIWLFVRRVGAPGTLTVELRSDVGGSPSAVLKTVTKTISDITDYVDVFVDFSPSSGQALTSGSIYHIVAYGASTDTEGGQWEVGVCRTTPGSKYSSDNVTWTAADYKMYYRITDANATKQYLFQTMNGTVYATSRPATGTSSFYSFSSGAFSSLSAGLTLITGRPLVNGGKMYFPQGGSVNIRTWDGASTFDNDGTNKATLLCKYHDTSGAQVARSLANVVSLAPSGASPLVFGTGISCGDTTYGLTNMVYHKGALWVFKQDEIGKIYNGVYYPWESNYEKTPSTRNGAAACSFNGLLYASWLNSMVEIYGEVANDVGQAWRGTGPKGNRAGAISCIIGVNAWRFCSIDAGASGYSSVMVFNGMTWHELYRAPYGHRIRDLWWKYTDGGHSYLLIDTDYDVVYLEFPTDVARPTADSTHEYAHSYYIETSTFDDGAARLPKYFKSITLSTTNCGTVEDTDVYFEVDYQTDNDVGSDGADHWRSLGVFQSSPESTMKLNLGNRRCIKLRVRGYTDSATTPPQLDAITLDGFTRTPARTVWTMRVSTGSRAVYKKRSSDLLKFLQEASTSADDIIVRSRIPELNGRHVIITRPKVQRNLLARIKAAWTGTMTISMMDMSE